MLLPVATSPAAGWWPLWLAGLQAGIRFQRVPSFQPLPPAYVSSVTFFPLLHPLQDMPAKYIYEPWTAPLSVQQAAGCVIGKDYPR
jgi:cryptochrome